MGGEAGATAGVTVAAAVEGEDVRCLVSGTCVPSILIISLIRPTPLLFLCTVSPPWPPSSSPESFLPNSRLSLSFLSASASSPVSGLRPPHLPLLPSHLPTLLLSHRPPRRTPAQLSAFRFPPLSPSLRFQTQVSALVLCASCPRPSDQRAAPPFQF